MKNIILFSLLLFSHIAFAQVPQGIPYQAAARNASGQPLVNAAVKVRFSIIDSVATGTTVYQETHSVTTNNVGLFNVNVGLGTPVTGTFIGINWGQNFKFMKVELDPSGSGSNYVDMGSQQMMSVPYALYAGSTTTNYGSNTSHVVIFDSAGTYTWTVPVGVKSVTVEIIGAGGGGGAGLNTSSNGGSGGGGGAGEYKKCLIKVSSGSLIQCVVGSKGIGATIISMAGGNGGSSSFGTSIIASGGGGGGGGYIANYPNGYGAGGTSIRNDGRGAVGGDTNTNDWRSGGGGGGITILGISGGSGAYPDLYYPYNLHPAQVGESNGTGGGGGASSWQFNNFMINGADGKDGLIIIYY